jgi:abortive infection bacteriophage resistance protein
LKLKYLTVSCNITDDNTRHARKGAPGRVFYYHKSMPTYSKPALSIQDQIRLLERRGLVVADKNLAAEVLGICNLYRFGGYALHFWVNSNTRPQQYQPGTRFEDVVRVMDFDRALRMLTMDAIERLEVAVRSAITSRASLFYNSPHWYLDSIRFKDRTSHLTFLSKSAGDFGRNKEIYVRHYKDKYSDPAFPPSWILAEISTFGTWSHLYKNLKERRLRNQIAGVFNLAHEPFEKNLHVLNNTRNYCAHHNRVWNRLFTFTPTLKQSKTVTIPASDHRSFAAQAGMIWVMLRAIEPNSNWTRDVRDLLVRYGINAALMGLPTGWDTDPFWSI